MCPAGVVTLEVSLVSRFWTWPFFIVTLLSYVLVFPFQVRPVPRLTHAMLPGSLHGLLISCVGYSGCKGSRPSVRRWRSISCLATI